MQGFWLVVYFAEKRLKKFLTFSILPPDSIQINSILIFAWINYSRHGGVINNNSRWSSSYVYKYTHNLVIMLRCDAVTKVLISESD